MKRIYAGVFAAVGWFAVIGQYLNKYADTLTDSIKYISFFTILSNILVAATLATAALAPESRLGRFLDKPGVATATVLYITVTGFVYHFLLASLYHLEGWTLIYDRLLHYVIPPAYVLFWLLFVPKGTLDLKNAALMLAFPVVYANYTLVRGPFADWYPYPFIDVSKLGYPQAFHNIVDFVILFAFVACVFVLIDRVAGMIRRAA